MATPLLSIVTPCLNAARFLPRALESVSSQPTPPGEIEHLIADGGSTDGSVELIAEHARRRPGLVARWTSGPDGGQSAAINRAFEHARGAFGAWLNADDWYEPGALAKVAAALRADPSADVLVGRCRFVDEGGRTVFAPRPPEPISVGELLRLKSRWFAGRSLVQPEVFFRLDLFRRVGGLNAENHHSMDYELWLRMLEAGGRFVTLDEDIACQGVHAGQKTADNRAVVRSVLGVALPALERLGPAMGEVEATVREELRSMARKLELADRVLPRWERALSGATGEGEAEAARAAIDREAQGGPLRSPAGGGEACEVAVRLAGLVRRRTWLRRSLRVVAAVGGSAEGTARVLQALGKRLDVTVVAFTPGAAERTRAALAAALDPQRTRMSVRLAAEGPLRPGGDVPTDADLTITEDLLFRAPDPGAVLADLWAALRPGGWLLRLAEPRPCPAMPAYLRRLTKRLSDQLSTDDDISLSPEADPALRAWAEEDLERWWRAHPGAAGVEIRAFVETLRPRPRLLAERVCGSLGGHPLAPFPYVGGREPARSEAWSVGLWRRPR